MAPSRSLDLPRNDRTRFDARRGVTLLELLVVMAIIAILASIVLAGVAGARSSAKGAICLSNLKEIGQATATYAANYAEFIPPAVTDAHPSLDEAVRRLGIDRMYLPVNYGWAELLHEWLLPGTVVADVVEFEPGRWSHFPVQRNFDGKYKGIFTCPASSFTENHAGHYRVYAPFWSPMAVEKDPQGRIEKVRIDHKGSRRITEFRLGNVLIGDANERDSSGDFDGLPFYNDLTCPCQECCPRVSEHSWIGIGWRCEIHAYAGEANILADCCGNRRGGTRFEHRHRDKANYLFGDSHAEASGTLREKLACDWNLDDVPDPPHRSAARVSQCLSWTAPPNVIQPPDSP